MAVYAWEGRARGGRVQKGEMEAPSRAAVITRLRGMEIQPIPGRIKEKGGGIRDLLKVDILPKGVSSKELVVFTRQFHTMVDAGLPIVQALDVLALQQQNKTFKNILTNVKEQIEGGSTLADAMGKHPRAFNELYANLVAAGETAGVLDTILQRLATYLEKIESIKRRIKGAMIYPAIVIFVAISVITVIMIFVIPTFAQVFEDLGTELPYLTRVVVSTSHWLKSNILFVLIGLGILAAVVVLLYRKTERGRRIIDALLLKIPLIGDLLLKNTLARFCRTLSTLSAGGIPILNGLEITAKSSGNKIVEEAIFEVRKEISEGKTLAEPMSKKPRLFLPMVVQMIAVGEETGALDDMLNKVADFYEEEVDVAVAALMTALEPAMIVFLGVTVGFIAVAMYLPMFKLIGALAA